MLKTTQILPGTHFSPTWTQRLVLIQVLSFFLRDDWSSEIDKQDAEAIRGEEAHGLALGWDVSNPGFSGEI